MGKYIIKRVLLIIPVILGITFFIFLVLTFAPGDPVSAILGMEATPEQIAAKRHELGLDQNVLMRYVTYILDAIRGNFGESWLSGKSVFVEFQQRVPHTFALSLVTLLLTTVFGISLGIIAAVKQNSPVDVATLVFALVFSSIPAFWFAMMMQIVFALHLGWFPSMGVGSLRHFILPALTLSTVQVTSQLRMTRSSMLDVINQDFVRTARAKGADESRVVLKHVVRNGSLPVITNLGLSFANTFGGAIVTETVFSIPGIGSYMINAAKARDVPIVMGVIIFVAIFVAFVNLIVDLIYAFVDPRVKLGYMS
jgi:peptide/nickel transport system permease protein